MLLAHHNLVLLFSSDPPLSLRDMAPRKPRVSQAAVDLVQGAAYEGSALLAVLVPLACWTDFLV
jgi:hypothetical protein